MSTLARESICFPWEGELTPRKYQNPRLEIRDDVARPYYYIRVMVPAIVNGERKTRRRAEKLGFVDTVSKDRAMQLRAETLDLVNSHRVIAQSLIRFKDLSDRYEKIRIPQLAVPTQNWEKTQIKNHVRPAFDVMKISDITRLEIENWLQSKSALSWWTRNGLKRILSRMFNAAKEWRMVEEENPVHGIRLGRKVAVYERRLLSVEDLRRLLAALPDRSKFIVLLIFGLGLRISEVLGLKWSDIDFEQKTISIARRWHRGDLAETKTEGSSAVLRLGPSLIQELHQRRGNHTAFLFGEGATPPDDRDLLREEFRPVLKKLGLYYRGFGWHAFRRQNISWKQQIGGATPLEAQRAARHASLDMTYLYTLSDAERETTQQQAMFDKLMEIEGGTTQ